MKRVLAIGGLMGLILICGCGKKATTGPNAAGWTGFDPEQGKFSVAMPGTPAEKPLKGGSAGKTWTSQADGLTYSVGYENVQMPAADADTDKVEQYMDDEVQWFVTTQGGTLTGQKKPLMVGSLPGREVDIDVDGKTLRRIRMCIAGNRLYTVEVSGPADKVSSSEVDAFLDSFKVAK